MNKLLSFKFIVFNLYSKVYANQESLAYTFFILMEMIINGR